MAIYLRRAFGLGLTGILGVAGALFSGSLALAQMTPDATLGAESSVVTPNVNVRGLPGDRIDGGAVRGANLFHSFQEFNVSNGQRVYFASPTGIENILSRVTGNNLSNILGTLGVDGGANLFLLNPNGIIFGQNAKLDIAGSFVASTANSVVFNNGYQFSAKNSEAPPLLTVNVPLGVQYGANQPKATIANAGNLAVGQNFTLSADNLDLQGQLQAGQDLTLQAQDTVKVRDSVTNPFVASSGGQLLVQGNEKVDIFALNHPNSGFFSGGDMVLRSPNSVIGDAHYWSGGNFRVEQLDGSLGDLDSPNDPIIRASGDVNFATYTGASLHILAGGSVTITGTVRITGTDTIGDTINPTATPILANVILSDDTTPLVINGNAQPTLDIRAGMNATFIGVPGITDTAPPFGVFVPRPNTNLPATSANITIDNINFLGANGFVLITNQFQPNLTLPGGNIQLGVVNATSDVGNGGSVFIDSRGSLTINPGFISTRSAVGNSGNVVILAEDVVSLGGKAYIGTATVRANSRNAGNITIKAGSLLVNPGSFIDAGTRGRGDSGIININVRDTISLSDSFISSSVESGAIGNGGIVNIDAGSVLISNAGLFVSTGIGATGTGGRLTVNAGTVQVADGGVVDASTSNASDAGSITFNVNKLEVIRGGQILTASSSTGKAGNLFINNADTVTVNSQGIINTGSTGTGSGGILSINTRQFNLSDPGSVVATNSLGAGKAGDLLITNADQVTVSNRGLLSTGSLRAGDAGTLSIQTRQLDVTNSGIDGGISTAALGTGNSGNLSVIATDSINVRSGGNILTFAAQGSSGNVELTTGTLRIRDNSSVLSSSFGGDAGDFTVRANSIEVVNGSKLSANTFGTGTGGDVLLDTRTLSVLNGGEISSVVTDTGSGNAGTITVRNANSVEVDAGKIATETYGRGNAGALTVGTGTLSVRNGGEVSTGVYLNSSGNGGKLSVNATDSVDLNGGSLVTLTVGSGAAGNMDINTRRLTAQNGGRIEARTASLSPGGTVTVNASESIELSGNYGSVTKQGTAISAFSDNLSIGNAPSGNIILNTGELIIRDGAQVTTQTLGRGKGGDIRVQANSLSLTNEGNITSRSDGEVNAGNAGNINLNVTGDLRSKGGIVSATSVQAGGGDINITADDIRLRDSSLVSTSVFDSTGGGGNITISSTVFLAIEDSDILANAQAGPGGDITIKSPAFIADLFSRGAAVAVGRNPGDLGRFRGNGRNDISVSLADSFRGNGQVNISAASATGPSGSVSFPNVDPTQRVAPLPSNLVDASQLIDRRCSPNSSGKKSSFTITGRGGLPPSPNDPLTNQEVWVDWITLEDGEGNRNSAATDAKPSSSNPKQLVEAQGWVIGEDGQVILTASAPTVTPGTPGLAYPSCEDNKAATE
jgi:filamentous hemagglutinin family protein